MRHSLLMLLVLGLGLPAHSQTVDSLRRLLQVSNNDSLRTEAYLTLMRTFRRSDAELSRRYLDSAEFMSADMKYPSIEGEIALQKGKLAFDQGEAELALLHLDTSAAAFMRGGIQKGLAKVDFNRANMYRNRDWERSTEHALASLQTYQSIGDSSGMADCYNMLGVIYKNTSKFEKAKTYYTYALDFARKQGSKNHQATLLLNLANLATRQKDFDSAIEYYGDAELIAKDMSRNQDILFYIYNGLSNMHSEKKEHQKALDYASLSYQMIKDQPRPREIATSLIGLGMNHLKLDQSKIAAQYLREAVDLAEAHDLTQVKERSYAGLSMALAKEGDHREAYQYLKKHEEIEDSVFNADVLSKVTELEAKYEQAEKELEISTLNAENAEQNLKLVKASRRNDLLALGLGVLAIVIGLLYRQNRIKQRNEKALADKNDVISKNLREKEFLLKEIHHRVKNNLQVVSSLLSLQSRTADLTTAAALNEGRHRVKSMALIHQSLYQDGDLTEIDFRAYVEKLTDGLLKSYRDAAQDQIDLNLSIPPINLDVDTVMPLGLILNELVTNALKYAFPASGSGKISIALDQQEDKITLRVADNGRGLPADEELAKSNSLGFKLIRAFVDKLKAEMQINRQGGTEVVIQFTP
ncbi:MAG: ATP-binding protein [Saprospiraceae bacterium]|nr:ATP-binding protein [Saprospiraceae bacterium]